MRRLPVPSIVIPLLLLLLCGCNCLQVFKPRPKLPTVFHATPTLDQLTAMVQRNSAAIRSISDDEATILVPGVIIPLKASIMLERPKRVRIRGGLSTLTGQEIDFGSNEELFWLWIKQLPERETYYCRHAQFASCPVRQSVPIEPDWVFEAFGMLENRPGETNEGPYPTDDGNLLLITQRPGDQGTILKKTTIDAKTGCILRQEIYTPQGILAAVAVSSDHRHDPATGILYARHIEFQCQGSDGKLTIDLNKPKFNTAFNAAEFVKPVFSGFPDVDICSPEFLNNRRAMPPNPAVSYQAPTSGPLQADPPAAYPYQHAYGSSAGASAQAAAQTMIR